MVSALDDAVALIRPVSEVFDQGQVDAAREPIVGAVATGVA